MSDETNREALRHIATLRSMREGPDCRCPECAAIEAAIAALAQRPEPAGRVEDGWIAWDGGPCPVPDDTLVDVRFPICEDFPTGEESGRPASCWNWAHEEGVVPIITYRLATRTGSTP